MHVSRLFFDQSVNMFDWLFERTWLVLASALISVVGDVRKVSHGESSVLAVHRRGLLAVFSRRLVVHLFLQP